MKSLGNFLEAGRGLGVFTVLQRSDVVNVPIAVIFPGHIFLELGLNVFAKFLDGATKIFERPFRFIGRESIVDTCSNNVNKMTCRIAYFTLIFYCIMRTYQRSTAFHTCVLEPIMNTNSISLTFFAFHFLFSMNTY